MSEGIENRLGNKLKELRLKKRLTLEQVGEQIGKTKQMVGYYESGKNQPSLSTIRTLAGLFGVSVALLHMYAEDVPEEDEKIEGENKLLSNVNKMITGEKAKLYLAQLPEKEAELYIPYFDVEITAGKIELYFDDVDEDPEGYVYAPQYRGCVMCNVKGDSMYERIFPGARLYVTHLPNKKYIDFGQIYLVVLDGYRLLKYILRHPSDDTKIILSSHNKHYEDWDVEKADVLNLFLVKGFENQMAI